MPSKLAGMMASGRPVIATAEKNAEIAEVLQGRGLAAPPGDLDAFCGAIRRVAARFEERKAMGERAREYAVSHFDKETVLKTAEDLFCGLITVTKKRR
jgi:colanic acid biosynthesis glycosyl transferase WcaI